ncbi:MAG: hypothetical protein JWO31_3937, partial [Phycisphaerales bacterium]|nr:hypothetical protein [Phycisphaerales bacterium]
SLWGGRRGLAASLTVCAAGAVAAAAYAKSLPLTATAAGDVRMVGSASEPTTETALPADAAPDVGVAHHVGTAPEATIVPGAAPRPTPGRGLIQRDRWTYVSAVRDARAAVPAGGLTRPVVAGRRQLAAIGLSLVCDPAGGPDRFEFALPAKQTVAFVTRTVDPAASADAAGPGDVPGPPSLRRTAPAPIGLVADRLYPGMMSTPADDPPADAPDGAWWGTAVMRR